MNCETCSKNYATIHVTEVVNGVKKESHLCEECARSSDGMFTFSITKVLARLKRPNPDKPEGESGGKFPK